MLSLLPLKPSGETFRGSEQYPRDTRAVSGYEGPHMKRRLFLLGGILSAAAVALGLKRKAGQFSATFASASKPVHPEWGYAVYHREPAKTFQA